METDADHCWLALATFESRDSLLRSVEELSQGGLGAEQICLVGHVRAIADCMHGSLTLHEYLGIAHRLDATATGRLPMFGPALAITNAAFESLLLSAAPAAGPVDGANSDRLRDFAAQIARGDVVLVVRSANAKQHVTATKALLAHSRERVTTYDFAVSTAEMRSR